MVVLIRERESFICLQDLSILFLELQSCSELHDSRIFRNSDRSCRRRVDVVIRHLEVRVIGDVEDLPAELQRTAFAKIELLREGEIDGYTARSIENIASRLPKLTGWSS